MSVLLNSILKKFRSESKTEIEKGQYFEKLVKVFLENDPIHTQHFDKVWHYADWAKEQGKDQSDIGIDLVANRRDSSGYCAIQCKFYKPDHSIQKADIDSFIAAASTADFSSLILVDTTIKDLSRNAMTVLNGLEKDFYRISLSDLEKSTLDWSTFVREERVSFIDKKTLRDHQKEALAAVRDGFAKDDRGKLIMACGTGKTFTALKISEELAGTGKLVLYMVPSLALMSQTVREWKNDSERDFLAFSVCSDVKIGKKEASNDIIGFTRHDLAFPATTDPSHIADQVTKADNSKMVVVFSTYQSIEAISDAQKSYGLPEFDLIICDEAHRTTGAKLAGEKESKFTRIHSNDEVQGKKRLYMTATPRVYGERAKSKAKQHDVILADMNDEEKFGKLFLHKSFSWAVENGLLSDYKVIVLAVDEGVVSRSIQNRFIESDELKLDNATKIIGCYKALTKQDLKNTTSNPPVPMKRALAFCENIAISKMIKNEFAAVVDDFSKAGLDEDITKFDLEVEMRHVDGTFNAKKREDCLNWLKADANEDICRVLTNARCLSEGVDVPALDAIMFLHPRKSQIDVVQSVGRVMRKAEGKDLGYVILPVVIPAGVKPEEALNDNERYQVVWQILNALRTHDERFDAIINQAGLGEDISDKIEFIKMPSAELEAITAVVEDINLNKNKKEKGPLIGTGGGGENPPTSEPPQEEQIGFVFDEFTKAIRAKIVEKCGTREFWEDWAKDIAKIAEKHITRITSIVETQGAEREAFLAFLEEIRDDLNPEIAEGEAIEMLAQHLITKPVFDTLFKDNDFTAHNPVSKAMDHILELLHQHNIAREADSLEEFYASVTRRAKGIKSATGRQALVVELYDKFFKNAFPKLTEKLGIVYTPVAVVDFIIHSVNDVLKSEFGQSLGSKGVHILDPFTGTGTFITRLLQSGLIKPNELEYKYKNEIHANEIVLLAYYIAAINIEAVYHDLAKEQSSGEEIDYAPFEGICLTDTFQLYEQEKDMIADLLPDNSERRTRQKELDIRVIIGNPPYSKGQKSANDDAANVIYTNLNDKIRGTYAKHSKATNKNALYDNYIRAIRWASDRIGEPDTDGGVVAFVSNAGWIDGNAMDGLRKCLKEEFSSIYVFHLRGNQRTKGEESRREAGKIFGSGSRAPIAITLLVRNPESQKQGQIYFHDIGDYLSREEKLKIIKGFNSIVGIKERVGWEKITPDINGDWLFQTDPSFLKYMKLGSKKDKSAKVLFANYSNGINSSRDAWVCSASKTDLSRNMQNMIEVYNDQMQKGLAHNEATADPKKIKWSSSLVDRYQRGIIGEFHTNKIRKTLNRPFEKNYLYLDPLFIHRMAKMPLLFPTSSQSNKAIVISGKGSSDFSCLMSEEIPSYDILGKSQCYPLYLYDNSTAGEDLFAAIDSQAGYRRKDAIFDSSVAHYRKVYPGEEISKEDLFYYTYGLLHSPEYRERFKNNLAKQLPRIPAVKKAEDFWAFSKAGRALGDLHINYENVEPYQVTFKEGSHDLYPEAQSDPVKFYRVIKMKFGSKGKEKDRSTVIYNDRITMQNIPLRAYDYIVNGRSALEWVMDRQCVKTDKASGIVNDANDYANETMNNPAYPLELFQRVITVSLKTLDIVEGLPQLDID